MQERQPRVAFTRPIVVSIPEGNDRPRRLLSANLSAGGMFVRAESAVSPGTLLSLSLEAKGRLYPFAEGEVVWADDPEELADDPKLPGFGLRFVRFLHPKSPELVKHLLRVQKPPGDPARSLGDVVTTDTSGPALPWSPSASAQQSESALASADLSAVPPRDFGQIVIRADASPAEGLPAWASSNQTEDPWATAPEARDFPSGAWPAPAMGPLAHDAIPLMEQEWFEKPSEVHPSVLENREERIKVATVVGLVAVLFGVAIGMLWWVHQTKDDAAAPTGAAPAAAASEQPAARTSKPSTSAEETAKPPKLAVQAPAGIDEHTLNLPAPEPVPSTVEGADPIAMDSEAQDSEQAVAAAESAPSAGAIEETEVVDAAPSAPPAHAESSGRTIALPNGAVRSLNVEETDSALEVELDLEPTASIDRIFVLQNPPRVVVDVNGASPATSARVAVDLGAIDNVRIGARETGTRLVLDMASEVDSAQPTAKGLRIALE